MKTFLGIWITWQLVIIGWTLAQMHNQILDKTFECKSPGKISPWKVATIPLSLFVPAENTKFINDYCATQST